MKKHYIIFPALLAIATTLSAKTYTIGSGKWTDANVWGAAYPGNTIKADDVVIITGQVTLNTGIVVEGKLQVQKGASMVGMKDLVISKSGTFVNDGNTVMNRIVNEGTINNNLIMEAMSDIDNKGTIGNNNSLVAGNNFNNFGGNAQGTNGAYFVNNNLHTSQRSTFGSDVRVLIGNQIEKAEKNGDVSPFVIDATLKANSVILNIDNKANLDVALYSIEKSTDGRNFQLLDMINNSKKDKSAVKYTDDNLSNELTYYRIKAINAMGEEIILPLTTVSAGTLSLLCE